MRPGLNQQANGLSLSDTVDPFKRSKRNSIIVTALLFIVSILILAIGLAATTRTKNITVGGYYPGVILGFGSFLGIIGAHLVENKRQMVCLHFVCLPYCTVHFWPKAVSFSSEWHFCNVMFQKEISLMEHKASYMENQCICVSLLVFFVTIHFCCVTVSSYSVKLSSDMCLLQDLRPFYAGRCEYYTSSTSFDRDVNCLTASRVSCNLRVKSNTCYCCELYNCGNRVELMGGYHEYTDVQSCQDVVHLYHLLWSATILNVVALFLGIITAAELGGFKDMTPTSASDSCEPEPLPVPAPCEPPPPTTSYNSYFSGAPCLPPYTPYDPQACSTFPDSSGLSDDSGASYMWPAQVPPRYSPPYYPPDEKPPPYSP
ncbi:transmembrane protein 255A-like [Anguilla rostrata]|uniref:transmembrane protein 255A-like n=1 Tax=Anguilla rostrata TaxID=7938 RepID=UPI0030D2048A